MNSTDPHSSDFSYKKYSLEQLDILVNDALNCEDLTPQDIYDTVVRCVEESVKYHKKYLDKSTKLLSLLKGHVEIEIDLSGHPSNHIENANAADWEEFWGEVDSISENYSADQLSKSWEENYYPEEHKQYTEEEMNAMCDAASDKEKCREYNLREAEYYTKRAELDANERQAQEIAKQVKADGYSTSEKKYKTYDEMIEEGWQMTDDGFWIKETDKGTLSISA